MFPPVKVADLLATLIQNYNAKPLLFYADVHTIGCEVFGQNCYFDYALGLKELIAVFGLSVLTRRFCCLFGTCLQLSGHISLTITC